MRSFAGWSSARGSRTRPRPAQPRGALARIERESPSLRLLRLKVRLGDAAAYERLLHTAADAKTRDAERSALVETLGQVGTADCVPTLLGVLASAKSESLRATTLTALQSFDVPQVPGAIEQYGKASAATRGALKTFSSAGRASRWRCCRRWTPAAFRRRTFPSIFSGGSPRTSKTPSTSSCETLGQDRPRTRRRKGRSDSQPARPRQGAPGDLVKGQESV